MGAIMCAPERVFSCEGSIRAMMWRSWLPEVGLILVEDPSDENRAPVMLEVRDTLKSYVEDVRENSWREDEMRKRFYFNQWCELRKIEVLDGAGNVVKTIKQGGEWRPFIGEEAESDGEKPDAEDESAVCTGIC